MSVNNISELPEFNGDTLQNLVTFVIDSNRLKSLPDSIASLKNLSTISLKSNNLLRFPIILFKLTKLRELHLDNNDIQKLPNGIARLKGSLKALTLSSCCLSDIAADVRFLKLNHLDLSNNPKLASTYDSGSVIPCHQTAGLFPSLFEITAVFIAIYDMPTQILPQSLQSYIGDFDYCVKCIRNGCITMYDKANLVWPLRKISAEYLAVDDLGCNTIITQGRMCLRCTSKPEIDQSIIC